MNLLYVISSDHDYSDYIPEDSGPAWSTLLNIQHSYFNLARFSEGNIYIIDPLLSGKEVEKLEAIAQNVNSIFIFRVVDPSGPPRDCNAVRQLAFKLSNLNRVGVLCTYHPTETNAFLASVFKNRFYVLPYAYDREKEVELSLNQSRRRKIVITGSDDKIIYPLRRFARHKRNTDLAWRLMTINLRSYGFRKACKGMIYGREYIDFLSSHSMMFLCPSRSEVEFMKYRECAYAGCMPVGGTPESLPYEASAAIIPINYNNNKHDRK